MRQSISLCSFLVALAYVNCIQAADLFVAPNGAAGCGCTSRTEPCDLPTAASLAMPGDNVILMDGVYKTGLWINGTGGTEAAWITFKADDCATPILEGPGVGPAEDVQDSGVGSSTAQYVRFQGIVARGFNIGFGNGWADGVESDKVSNGHWEIEHCISYSNGRTGFTFFSAPNFHLKNSIAAHNGTSTLHAWSSGVTLFEATGTNVVEGTISFENSDEQKRTDGSGFIVDEASHNALFINNIAFRNAGSCLRLTDSRGTKFINNTCYQNSQFGSRATGPTNPSEIYFTNGGITIENVNFQNNAIVGTGVAPAGATPIQNQPTSGWANNVVTTNGTGLFTDASGTNPNYVPTGADLLGKGGTGANVPTKDIGFDPKCLVKRAPQLVGQIAKGSWWEFDIDIDYVKSIGGVKGCFNPGTRATNDIGAYKAGAVTTVTPGACTPVAPPAQAPSCSSGGASGTAGAGGGGSSGGGAAPIAGSGGAGPAAGGAPGQAGSVSTPGGATSTPTGGTPSSGGASTPPSAGAGGAPTAPSAGGTPSGTAGSSQGAGPGTATGGAPGGPTTPPPVGGNASAGAGTPPPASDEGCGCRVAPVPHRLGSVAGLGLLGLGLVIAKRRRRAR
jgi:MYXO-CTERM domain-containing protein